VRRGAFLLATARQSSNIGIPSMNPKLKLLLVALASASLALYAFGSGHDANLNSVSADAALTKLQEGNARFVASSTSSSKPNAAKRAETSLVQKPYAIILACADSRLSPEIIFDQNIGDIFVIRNAGNLVDDHVEGSIEYAVEHLGTRLIVVLGHERCGAVSAAVAGPVAPAHVQSLVTDILPAVQAVKGKEGDIVHLAVAENARRMAEQIKHEASLGEAAHDVKIVSAVYDLDTGKVSWAK